MSLKPPQDESVAQQNRTEKRAAYEDRVGFYRERYDSDPDFRRRFQASVRQIRGVSATSVHQNKLLNSFSVQYANDVFIGERLMPVVTVDHKSDSFAIYNKRDRLAAPDDRVTERARPAELNETRTTDNYSVKDYAFTDYLDASTEENQDPVFDEMLDLVEFPAEMLALKREQRIATILTTGANYAGNTAAAAVAWTTEATSTPDIDIMNAVQSTWRGRGGSSKLIAFAPPEVINPLLRHPRIRGLNMYVKEGYTPLRTLAAYFGLDDILVAGARQDTANSGSAAAYSRIWGKVFGIVAVANTPTKRSLSFGNTFRMRGMPRSTQWFNPEYGVAGGFVAKVACSEDHKVVAADSSFLITAAVP